MKSKAIFLDRDGVINLDVLNYTWKIEDFKILEGVFEACKIFHKAGYLLIIITNQGGIARELYSHNDVVQLHHHLRQLFAEKHIPIHDIYYCPHHESTGRCLCRKPGSLMLEKAIARYDIDPDKSFMIGDRERDVLAAQGAGVKGIQVDVNDDLRKVLSIVGL